MNSTNEPSLYLVKVSEAWYDVYIGRNSMGEYLCLGRSGI
jgi:hypothetical protein